MSFDMDEDILQDFLIEAGEILEQLSEQLVELENDPQNKDLLNAIFRGFLWELWLIPVMVRKTYSIPCVMVNVLSLPT